MSDRVPVQPPRDRTKRANGERKMREMVARAGHWSFREREEEDT